MTRFQYLNGNIIRDSGLAALAGLCALAATPAAAAEPSAQAQATWQAAISRGAPASGCFEASFPSTAWTKVACVTVRNRPLVPTSGHGGGLTVGDGNDYTAAVTSLITSATGSFPKATGLRKETGQGQANSYSIQLNSQFFTTSVCKGAADSSQCQGWQQFAYVTGDGAFMQYWLINYGNACPPGGWMKYGSDCYRNSNGVRVPNVKIKQLTTIKVTGTAAAGGNDSVIFMTKKKAYTATGPDTVVNLANSWEASEFNVIGPGGGSEADFSAGTSITVGIAVTDGNTTAPTCPANSGTTGETNNLNLGACTTSGGAAPSISFVESN